MILVLKNALTLVKRVILEKRKNSLKKLNRLILIKIIKANNLRKLKFSLINQQKFLIKNLKIHKNYYSKRY